MTGRQEYHFPEWNWNQNWEPPLFHLADTGSSKLSSHPSWVKNLFTKTKFSSYPSGWKNEILSMCKKEFSSYPSRVKKRNFIHLQKRILVSSMQGEIMKFHPFTKQNSRLIPLGPKNVISESDVGIKLLSYQHGSNQIRRKLTKQRAFLLRKKSKTMWNDEIQIQDICPR